MWKQIVNPSAKCLFVQKRERRTLGHHSQASHHSMVTSVLSPGLLPAFKKGAHDTYIHVCIPRSTPAASTAVLCPNPSPEKAKFLSQRFPFGGRHHTTDYFKMFLEVKPHQFKMHSYYKGLNVLEISEKTLNL